MYSIVFTNRLYSYSFNCSAHNRDKEYFMKKPVQDNKTAVSEIADTDNVDKIRDILFGNQMRDFDRKFDQLEQRLADEIDNLRKENSLQIESLQTYLDSEIAILSSKLSNEEQTRINELDDLDETLKKNIKQIDTKILDLANLLDTQARETNQKVLKQSQDFNAEMNQQLDLIKKRMDDYKQHLNEGKVDKSHLAEMFNTLAVEINGDK